MKIIADIPAYAPILDRLRQPGGIDIRFPDVIKERARELPPDLIKDADVLFCTFPPTNLEAMQALKWIQISSTGYTQLFGLGLPERGIRVTNARGCFDCPIAEWAVAMMVNLARDLRTMIRNQDARTWDRSAIFQNEIRGKTVGLWGYGGIGRETARLSRQLGLRVHVLTRSTVQPRRDVYCVPGTGDPEGTLPDRFLTSGQELEFLAELDFLIVAMPLTKATEGLIGERELRALPPHAFVLNPARGPIIQEQALLEALRDSWIAGAALDTHYQYPLPAEHPLWRFPNVILTPHISGSSLGPNFAPRLWDIFATNVERWKQREPLLNELTKEQLNGQ